MLAENAAGERGFCPVECFNGIPTGASRTLQVAGAPTPVVLNAKPAEVVRMAMRDYQAQHPDELFFKVRAWSGGPSQGPSHLQLTSEAWWFMLYSSLRTRNIGG